MISHNDLISSLSSKSKAVKNNATIAENHPLFRENKLLKKENEELFDKVRQLEETLKKSPVSDDNKSGNLAEYKKQIQELKDHKKKDQEIISRLEAENSSIKKNLTNIENERNELFNLNTSLTEKLSANKEKYTKLEKTNENLEEKIETLYIKIEKIQANNETNDSSGSSEEDIAELKNEISILTKLNASLESELELVSTDLKSMRTDRDDYAHELDDLKLKNEADRHHMKLQEGKSSSHHENKIITRISDTMINTIHSTLNLSANARKMYDAIIECAEGKPNHWVQISSKRMKKEFKVHSAYYNSARLELRDDFNLIDFKEGRETGTNRPIIEYALLIDNPHI